MYGLVTECSILAVQGSTRPYPKEDALGFRALFSMPSVHGAQSSFFHPSHCLETGNKGAHLMKSRFVTRFR